MIFQYTTSRKNKKKNFTSHCVFGIYLNYDILLYNPNFVFVSDFKGITMGTFDF